MALAASEVIEYGGCNGLDIRLFFLDNLVYGHSRIFADVLKVPLVVGQLGDLAVLDQLLGGTHPAVHRNQVQALLHFAACTYVGESVAETANYYRNNVGDSLTLLGPLMAEGERRRAAPLPPVISSSSASSGGS